MSLAARIATEGARMAQACTACGHYLGVRQIILDGRLVWFCARCPTPAEIGVARLEIQSGWSAIETWARSGRPAGVCELEVLRDDRRRVRNGCRGI